LNDRALDVFETNAHGIIHVMVKLMVKFFNYGVNPAFCESSETLNDVDSITLY
jgi:hypothetical protein